MNVAVRTTRWVATHGDFNAAEVNKGAELRQGLFPVEIMYGNDRLTTPLLRMKDGKYAKDGEFAPVSWDQAFDVMAEGSSESACSKNKGRKAVGIFGSGQWTGNGKATRRAQADESGGSLQQPGPERAPLHGVSGGKVHAHLRRR